MNSTKLSFECVQKKVNKFTIIICSFYSKHCHLYLKKGGWDPGSGKNQFRIQDCRLADLNEIFTDYNTD
jgi:hypothetical protein